MSTHRPRLNLQTAIVFSPVALWFIAMLVTLWGAKHGRWSEALVPLVMFLGCFVSLALVGLVASIADEVVQTRARSAAARSREAERESAEAETRLATTPVKPGQRSRPSGLTRLADLG